MMIANAALRGKVDSSSAASDDEMLLDDIPASSAGEGRMKVAREDSPMAEAEDGYDVAMDLLQGLEEYAEAEMKHA